MPPFLLNWLGRFALKILIADKNGKSLFFYFQLHIFLVGTLSTNSIDLVHPYPDNAPVFFEPKGGYRAEIAEDANIGSKVMEVKANDVDSGKNQLLVLRLVSNDSGVLGSVLSEMPLLWMELEDKRLTLSWAII